MNIGNLKLYHNNSLKRGFRMLPQGINKNIYTGNYRDILKSDNYNISNRGKEFVKAKEIVKEENEVIREELVKTVKKKIEKNIYLTEVTAELIADKIVNGWRNWDFN